MKTAPFDREPPFVLLPTKRETLWRKLINRLRFGLGKSKRDVVDGELKGLDALQASPKMSGGNDFLSSLAASNTHNRAGNNFNNSYSTLNAVGGNNVESSLQRFKWKSEGLSMKSTSLAKLVLTIAMTRWHRLKLSWRRLRQSWRGK